MSRLSPGADLAGYWPSHWPGEDGGPRRSQAPHGVRGLGIGPNEVLQATHRPLFAPTMTVARQPGELYVLAHTLGPDSISWVERIDPVTLETDVRSPDLAAGPFWPGGVAAHANGSLVVTYGRWCHRLDADCQVVASRELPRDRPYNSLVVLADGHLVMKDFALDPADGSLSPTCQLVVLEPEGLEVVATHELPEGSIARLSADGDTVYVVGDTHVFRLGWDGQHLTPDDAWTTAYRTAEGQTFAWDTVIEGGAAWFLDDGAGTEHFGGGFRGRGISTAPLRLWRVPLDGSPPASVEVCGRPGGIVANPPLVDPERRIAVGYDSGNAVLAAWRYGEPGEWDLLWRRDQGHGAHMLRFPDTGEIVTCDHDPELGEQCVVLDIETGAERGRVALGMPVQSVLFPSVGWDRDVYLVTFAGITRVHVASAG